MKGFRQLFWQTRHFEEHREIEMGIIHGHMCSNIRYEVVEWTHWLDSRSYWIALLRKSCVLNRGSLSVSTMYSLCICVESKDVGAEEGGQKLEFQSCLIAATVYFSSNLYSIHTEVVIHHSFLIIYIQYIYIYIYKLVKKLSCFSQKR